MKDRKVELFSRFLDISVASSGFAFFHHWPLYNHWSTANFFCSCLFNFGLNLYWTYCQVWYIGYASPQAAQGGFHGVGTRYSLPSLALLFNTFQLSALFSVLEVNTNFWFMKTNSCQGIILCHFLSCCFIMFFMLIISCCTFSKLASLWLLKHFFFFYNFSLVLAV